VKAPETTTPKKERLPVRYGIRVVFPDGAVAFLRHGPVVGSGPIVRFRSKRDAEVNLDFIREGLDSGAHASIFRITRGQP
jgi:hypothetical protein